MIQRRHQRRRAILDVSMGLIAATREGYSRLPQTEAHAVIPRIAVTEMQRGRPEGRPWIAAESAVSPGTWGLHFSALKNQNIVGS
jgi:hypothetical protein